MESIWLEVANLFFYVFHTTLILFNLAGWAFKRLRRLHLISMGITFGSWIILGFWYGWGYCFLTDWHYRVLRALGHEDLPRSYIAFLVRSLTGWLPPGGLVDALTVGLGLAAFGVSIWLNRMSGYSR